MNFTLTRNKDNGIETLGTLVSSIPEKPFICFSLERPWKHNLSDISCIPAGTYTCKWAFQGDLNEWHYELQNVPNRSGIFIHEANYVNQIEGCIGLGATEADINGDGQLDVTSSKATLAQFEALGENLDIQLTIIAVN